jgi:hypothetical protein
VEQEFSPVLEKQGQAGQRSPRKVEKEHDVEGEDETYGIGS